MLNLENQQMHIEITQKENSLFNYYPAYLPTHVPISLIRWIRLSRAGIVTVDLYNNQMKIVYFRKCCSIPVLNGLNIMWRRDKWDELSCLKNVIFYEFALYKIMLSYSILLLCIVLCRIITHAVLFAYRYIRCCFARQYAETSVI